MKMKKMYKSLLSMLLALTMLFSSQAFSESVLAASAATSTDAIDGADEATTHAEVFFVNKANGNLITVSGKENDPILVEKKFTTTSSVDDSAKFLHTMEHTKTTELMTKNMMYLISQQSQKYCMESYR